MRNPLPNGQNLRSVVVQPPGKQGAFYGEFGGVTANQRRLVDDFPGAIADFHQLESV